jgi:hypothetical protein
MRHPEGEQPQMMNPNVGQNFIQAMTLEQVREAFHEVLTRESTSHHELGRLYNHVVDHKLAENTPYKNAPGFFAAHFKDVARQTLVRYGAVARNFTAAVCGQFGATRLGLLLAYKEATGLQLDHAEPGGTSIQVPDENGVVAHKPFSDCSVMDLRKAMQRQRRPTSSAPLPAEALALVEQYRTAVTSRFSTQTPVRVSVRNLGGQAVISFKDIPLSQLEALTEALIDGGPSLRVVA